MDFFGLIALDSQNVSGRFGQISICSSAKSADRTESGAQCIYLVDQKGYRRSHDQNDQSAPGSSEVQRELVLELQHIVRAG